MKRIFLLWILAPLIQAAIPSSRYNGGCVYVKPHIHCYGGTSDQRPTADHYQLDLSQDFTVKTNLDRWQDLSHPADFTLEPNSLFTITAFNQSLMIHGGLGYGSTQRYVKNSTTLFDASQQTWKAIHSNQTMRTREGTATLDSTGRIWMWGGLSDNTSLANLTKTSYAHTLTLFDTNNASWSNQTSPVPPRLEHSATLINQSIYFIGGLQISDSDRLQPALMSDLLRYDILHHTWTQLKTNTSLVPSSRRLHSATAIPNTDLILVYGGSATDSPKVVSDFIYLLNTTSLTWSVPSLDLNDLGAGPRFGHSAVLYGQRSLFLIFGVDTLGLARNDYFLLDLVQFRWLSEFKSDPSLVPPSLPSPTLSTLPSSPVTSDAGSLSVSLLFLFLFLI